MPRRSARQVPEEFSEDWALIRSLSVPNKAYVGLRTKNGGYLVKIRESVRDTTLTKTLPSCRNHVKHSHGFAWGYSGSGPAQLAYAILFDHTKDAEKTARYYQDLKFRLIAGLPEEGWEIPESKVKEILAQLECEENSTPQIG